MMKMNLGDRVYYTGDMANVDGFGIVAGVRPVSKYAPESYDIAIDDGRMFRCVYGVMFDAGSGRRFWPLPEWEADREAKFTAMLERARTNHANKGNHPNAQTCGLCS